MLSVCREKALRTEISAVKKTKYGLWIKEVLDHYNIPKISFAVSSYSSAMFLSFAKAYPHMTDKAL